MKLDALDLKLIAMGKFVYFKKPILPKKNYVIKKEKVVLNSENPLFFRGIKLPELKTNKINKFKRPKYVDYIKSKSWNKRRIEYFKKFGKSCVICFIKKVQLHHMSYINLGRELDEDLIALCIHHHKRLHEEVKTALDMRVGTYQFIIDEQETEELKKLMKDRELLEAYHS